MHCKPRIGDVLNTTEAQTFQFTHVLQFIQHITGLSLKKVITYCPEDDGCEWTLLVFTDNGC